MSFNDRGPVAIAFAPAPHDPILDRVAGTTFLSATADLEPDDYCIDSCATVTATFDTREPDIAPIFAAHAQRSYGTNGCGEDAFCSGETSRYVNISLHLQENAPGRTAGWLVEYGPNTRYAEAPVQLLGTYGDLVQLVDSYPNIDLEDLRQICVQIRSVLWDGTVGAPHDLGCAAFE